MPCQVLDTSSGAVVYEAGGGGGAGGAPRQARRCAAPDLAQSARISNTHRPRHPTASGDLRPAVAGGAASLREPEVVPDPWLLVTAPAYRLCALDRRGGKGDGRRRRVARRGAAAHLLAPSAAAPPHRRRRAAPPPPPLGRRRTAAATARRRFASARRFDSREAEAERRACVALLRVAGAAAARCRAVAERVEPRGASHPTPRCFSPRTHRPALPLQRRRNACSPVFAPNPSPDPSRDPTLTARRHEGPGGVAVRGQLQRARRRRVEPRSQPHARGAAARVGAQLRDEARQ